MVLYHGALDYYVVKKNGKSVIILLDNHASEEYCKYTAENINKLFEDYVYAYIEYAILNSKLGVQEYVIARARKRKSALLRNAKIRISNIHPGRLLMNMRGKDKWLK